MLVCIISLQTDGDLKNKIILDRIAVGIHDVSLLEWLQMDPELTLEKEKNKEKPLMSSNVYLREVLWILLQLMQSLTHLMQRQKETTDQMNRRNICGAGRPHTHMHARTHARTHTHTPVIAALPEMRSGKIGHFGAVCLTRPLNIMIESDTGLHQIHLHS